MQGFGVQSLVREPRTPHPSWPVSLNHWAAQEVPKDHFKGFSTAFRIKPDSLTLSSRPPSLWPLFSSIPSHHVTTATSSVPPYISLPVTYIMGTSIHTVAHDTDSAFQMYIGILDSRQGWWQSWCREIHAVIVKFWVLWELTGRMPGPALGDQGRFPKGSAT